MIATLAPLHDQVKRVSAVSLLSMNKTYANSARAPKRSGRYHLFRHLAVNFQMLATGAIDTVQPTRLVL